MLGIIICFAFVLFTIFFHLTRPFESCNQHTLHTKAFAARKKLHYTNEYIALTNFPLMQEASRNQTKEEIFFRWLHFRKFDDVSLEDFWRAERDGDILFCARLKASKGQFVILFRLSLCKERLNVSADKTGRFLIVNVSIVDDEFCFVIISAPNDQTQQIIFYEKMINSIRCRQTNKLSGWDKFGGMQRRWSHKSCNLTYREAL